VVPVSEPSHAVFLSYASQDAEAGQNICAALRAAGIEVWFDQSELRGGDAWDHSIRKQIKTCSLFLPVISHTTHDRDEGYFRLEWKLAVDRCHLMAADKAFLLPVVIDDTRDDDERVPERFREVQWMRLPGGATSAAFVERVRRLLLSAELSQEPTETQAAAALVSARAASTPGRARVAICVLAFANMSGDPEQEYFSDGITEDIITDLSKVSALAVTSRNSAFVFKGKHVDVMKVARELKVSHVLEGSVRKAGGRVRITAQLVDGASNDHLWAERYDRDVNDIFALQDEISKAIVKALKLRLLPDEEHAIERRGTNNVEAYNLYLMGRQLYVSGPEGNARRAQAIVRLCTRATEIDPGYARAWALMAHAQMILRQTLGKRGDEGLVAAERALVLDPKLPEAHAVKARILADSGRNDEASAEIDIALGQDAESYEVIRSAAYLSYRRQRLEDAIRYWEKATNLMDTDINSPAMLMSCYVAVGDSEAARRSARIALSRAEKAVAQDPSNGAVTAYSAYALATLGEAERAKERMNRALLIDPDDWSMRYNFACVLLIHLHEPDAALDVLGPVLKNVAASFISHIKVDPDFMRLRDNPRFKAMIAAAEERLAAENQNDLPPKP
jgi:adenylate cyclase